MNKKFNISILEIVAVAILLIGGYFFFFKNDSKPADEVPPKENEPVVVPVKETNTQTYTNAKYGISFDYPKTISFKNDTYVAGATEVESFKANTAIPIVIENISDSDYLLSLSVPVLQFTLSVSRKPSDFEKLADFVRKEMEKMRVAGENSAAGVVVSDPNPEVINGNPAISFSLQGGGAMGNNTSIYYLEKGNFIYSLSYFYSAAIFQGLSGDSDAKADEIKRVDAVQKILSSLKII